MTTLISLLLRRYAWLCMGACLTLCIMSCEVRTGGYPGHEAADSYVSDVGGKRLVFLVDLEKIRDTEEWEPNQDSPMNLNRVIEIARREAVAYSDNKQEWKVRRIEMARFEDTAHWYFVVDLVRKQDGSARREFLTIPILMNGEPIKGTGF